MGGTRADGFPNDVDERAQAEAYRAYEAQRRQLGQLHSLARWGQSQVASMQDSLNTMEDDPQQQHVHGNRRITSALARFEGSRSIWFSAAAAKPPGQTAPATEAGGRLAGAAAAASEQGAPQ